MTADQVRQIVRSEFERIMHVVLTGVSANADGQANEDITNMLPGVPPITKRPVAFPYGYNAQTPDKVSQLVLQAGNSPLNRIVAGHFDATRPSINKGEVILYNAFGQQIYLANGKILIGSEGSSQPFVLGTTFNMFIKQLLDLIIAHTHASPGAPPTNAPAFTALETNFVTNNALLSTEVEGQ